MQPEGSWARCCLWLSCTKWKSSLAQGGGWGTGGKRGLCGVSSGCGNLRCNCREEAPNQDVVARPGKFFDTNNTQSLTVCVCVCTFYSAFCVIYFYQRFSLSTAARNKFSSLWFFLLASFGSGDKPTLQLLLLLARI